MRTGTGNFRRLEDLGSGVEILGELEVFMNPVCVLCGAGRQAKGEQEPYEDREKGSIFHGTRHREGHKGSQIEGHEEKIGRPSLRLESSSTGISQIWLTRHWRRLLAPNGLFEGSVQVFDRSLVGADVLVAHFGECLGG